MISNKRFGLLCSLPGLIALIIFFVYPVFYNIYVSFLKADYGMVTSTIVGLRNYKSVLSSSDLTLSWKVSTIYSIGTTLMVLLISLAIAHSLHGIKKMSAFFRTLSILPWAVPLVISGLMWKWIFSMDLGIINYILLSLGLIHTNVGFLINPNLAMLSGIITTTWSYIPFVTVLLLAGLESIPDELYEASKIDGADALQRFRFISIPLNIDQILTSSLIVWMYTFRTPDAFMSLTAGGPRKATYHAGIYLWDLIYKFMDFGKAGALSVFLTITVFIPAIIILYLFMRRSEQT